jgi:AcrR family transcriptional regulator
MVQMSTGCGGLLMAYRQTARSERVRAAARGRILRAARRLFASRGYAGTTVQHIVDAAKTSVGNFYFYFAHKEELLRALLEQSLTDAWRRGDEAMTNVPRGSARLAVMFFVNALGLLHADRDLTRLIFVDQTGSAIPEHLVAVNTERVRRVLEENLPEYPRDLLDTAATAWVGAGRHFVQRWVRGELTGDLTTQTAFLARWNLRGLGLSESEVDAAIATAEALVPAHPVAPRVSSGRSTGTRR